MNVWVCRLIWTFAILTFKQCFVSTTMCLEVKYDILYMYIVFEVFMRFMKRDLCLH